MKIIDIFTSAIVAMLLGALLVVGGGNSFAANAGVIVFCYGLFGVGYAGVKTIFP